MVKYWSSPVSPKNSHSGTHSEASCVSGTFPSANQRCWSWTRTSYDDVLRTFPEYVAGADAVRLRRWFSDLYLIRGLGWVLLRCLLLDSGWSLQGGDGRAVFVLF